MKDKELRQRLGEAGRKTVIERFGIDRFVKEWDNMFRATSNMIYRGECVV
jgi:glycosyltransferase involved in cell wall biosynthesis